MNQNWETIFQGNLIWVETIKEKWYEKAFRTPWVRLIVTNNEDKFLITKEFRRELQTFDYRFPWGKVFDSLVEYEEIRGNSKKLEEAVLKAAQIEAKEEAGIDEMENIKILTKSTLGATMEWDIYYVTAAIKKQSTQNLGWEEQIHGIELLYLTEKEIFEMIQNGSFQEDRSIGIFVKYFSKQLK